MLNDGVLNVVMLSSSIPPVSLDASRSSGPSAPAPGAVVSSVTTSATDSPPPYGVNRAAADGVRVVDDHDAGGDEVLPFGQGRGERVCEDSRLSGDGSRAAYGGTVAIDSTL